MLLFKKLQRNILAATSLSLALFLGAHQGLAGSFLGEVDDLPLMTGLTPLQNTGVVFDSPQGRIVEVYTAGKVTRADVLTFYGEALPQLGWIAEDVGNEGAAWRRDDEVLKLMFSGTGPILTVHFSLAPHGAMDSIQPSSLPTTAAPATQVKPSKSLSQKPATQKTTR